MEKKPANKMRKPAVKKKEPTKPAPAVECVKKRPRHNKITDKKPGLLGELEENIEQWAVTLTLRLIADRAGIAYSTLQVVLKGNPLLLGLYKKGRAKAIHNVAGKLYMGAMQGDTTKQAFFLNNYAKLQGANSDDEDFDEPKRYQLPASALIGSFSDAHFVATNGRCTDLFLTGGRLSGKTTAAVQVIVELLENDPNAHALVIRRHNEQLRGSVYNAITKVVVDLNIGNAYKNLLSPLQIEKKSTKQTLVFVGANRAENQKGLAPKFGYFKVLWFEEADQLRGEAEVRSLTQTALRGAGDVDVLRIFSFNIPINQRHWANRFLIDMKSRASTFHSNTSYLSGGIKLSSIVGKYAIQEAEHLRDTNPKAYAHEYLGEAVGLSDAIFENLVLREITEDEILGFERVAQGIDWGWKPDPTVYAKTCLRREGEKRALYVFFEYGDQMLKVPQLFQAIEAHLVQGVIFADHGKREIADMADLLPRNIEIGMTYKADKMAMIRWLQGIDSIIIDPARCPNTAHEFAEYCYDMDREGEIIERCDDGADDYIDAVRYSQSANYLSKEGGKH